MKALLVVDIQAGLMEKNIFNRESFIITVNNAIVSNRNKGNKVIFIQHNNKMLEYNKDSWKIFNLLDQKINDIYVQKKHGNAFEDTNLKSILNESGIEEIIVCGLVSNGCIKATCIGAIEEGLKVQAIKNGHSNWNKKAQEIIHTINEEMSKINVEIIDF